MRPFRHLIRCVPLLLLVGEGPRAAPARRPPVDASAMREAVAPPSADPVLVSSASLGHALKASLASLAGEHRRAVDELRLALATDDGNAHLLTRLGEAYAQLGDFAAAETELRRAVRLHPSSHAARRMLGRVLLVQGKPGQAEAELRRAIQAAPREPETYLLLSQLHVQTRAYDRAMKVADELATALPGESAGYRTLGLALAARGEDVRAERMLARARERDPEDVEVLLGLAKLYEKAGRLAEAEDALARALERDPDSQPVLVDAGRLALRLGSTPRARAYFDRLLSLSSDPELTVQVALSFLSAGAPDAAAQVLDTARQGRAASPRLSFYAGLVHERLRQFERAALAYAEVPGGSELAANARTRRGVCLSQLGQHAEALALLRQSLAEHPEDLELRVQEARALERGGEPERAVATLREALARRPEAELREALVATLRRQKRSAEALVLLRQAVARAPRELSARYLLASVLLEDGDEEGALREMRGVLALEPDHAAALNFAGYLLARRGRDLGEAERLVRRALAQRPEAGAFLDSLGWIHYQRGDYARAVEVLTRAAALEPGEPVILEHLGDAWRRLPRPEEAARAWRRALEVLALEPEAADPPDQRELLERKLKLLSTGATDR